MDRRRKRDQVMQELFDELSCQLVPLLQQLKADKMSQRKYLLDRSDLLIAAFARLVGELHVRSSYALAMIMTVDRIISWREGIVIPSLPCDPINERRELATSITHEILSHCRPHFQSDQRRILRQYVMLLLTRYSNLRESCGSLFQSEDNGAQCLDNTSPTAVRNLKTMRVWEERDVMQRLCEWVLKDYQQATRRIQNPERLQEEWSYRLVERSYRRLTDRFDLRVLRALSMVQVAGYFVRQHLAIDTAEQGVLVEHEELRQAEDLTTAVVCDLDPDKITDRTRSQVYRIVMGLLAAYRRERLVRQRREL